VPARLGAAPQGACGFLRNEETGVRVKPDGSNSEATASAPVAPVAPSFGSELRARFRYRLIKRLGKGSFGSVFFARCLDHDRRRDDSPPERVAIKILGDAKGASSDLARRELAALLAIQHDRIPRVYDWRLDVSPAFVVMEYFPEGSLRDQMTLAGPAEEDQVWRLLGDLLSALDIAHRASLLHLDIKPANVLLDGRGGFVLTDFGVAQASRISRGVLPFSVGTRGYQAPEQRNERFDQYDLRTDLWGVGVTAWAFATGVNLAERGDLVRTDGDDQIYGLPALSERRLTCSPELEEVIMSMLFLDPARRPGSVAEVQARVTAAVSGWAFESATYAASRRSNLDDVALTQLIESLVDPLLIDLCKRPGLRPYFVKFEDGEQMCGEGEHSYYAFLLLKGSVTVSRAGRELARVEREGSFLSEVATLTSLPRTASMHAAGAVWAVVLNAAELERFVTANPAIGLRFIRTLAHRLAKLPRVSDEKRRSEW
jgi:serine/threonine protein kinase